MVPLWVGIALVVLILLVLYFFFGSFAFGAGYQPTPSEVRDRMLEYAGLSSADVVYDLGAGTGALLFQAVERSGCRGIGVELEPTRYLLLRWRRRRSAQAARLQVLRADLFAQDLTPATVVLTFLWPGAMARLKEKLARELAVGVRVVSYYHPVPGWEPERADPKLKVYLYRMPPRPSP